MNRRRFRYRLTTLLAIMLAFAIGAAGYGNHLRTIQRQNEAMRAVSRKGGETRWDRFNRTRTIVFQPIGFGCGQIWVTPAKVSGDTFSDNDLPLIDSVPGLTAVGFDGSRVSPQGIERFKRKHPDCSILGAGGL